MNRLLKRRIPTSLVVLCIVAALLSIGKGLLDMRVWFAAWGGDLVAVLLLQRGADPNTGLGAAVVDGDPALINLIFAHGQDVHGKETRNALSLAISRGEANMVALLLRRGVDPNMSNSLSGKTSLQKAHNAEALKQHDSARIPALLRAAGAK